MTDQKRSGLSNTEIAAHSQAGVRLLRRPQPRACDAKPQETSRPAAAAACTPRTASPRTLHLDGNPARPATAPALKPRAGESRPRARIRRRRLRFAPAPRPPPPGARAPAPLRTGSRHAPDAGRFAPAHPEPHRPGPSASTAAPPLRPRSNHAPESRASAPAAAAGGGRFLIATDADQEGDVIAFDVAQMILRHAPALLSCTLRARPASMHANDLHIERAVAESRLPSGAARRYALLERDAAPGRARAAGQPCGRVKAVALDAV